LDGTERDPNDPTDQPFFAVKTKILNQAFHAWMTEQGGEVVLDDARKRIRSNIISLISMEVKGMDEMFRFAKLKAEIENDLKWFTFIKDSFFKIEEIKKAKEIPDGR
jgi:hypothetical protein